MAKIKKPNQPLNLTLDILNYDYIVYAGKQGVPPDNNIPAGTELSYLTIVGNCREFPCKNVVFYVTFFPTGTQIQLPVCTSLEAGAFRVDVQMDASQISAVVGVLEKVPHAVATYAANPGGAPNAQICTNRGVVQH